MASRPASLNPTDGRGRLAQARKSLTSAGPHFAPAFSTKIRTRTSASGTDPRGWRNSKCDSSVARAVVEMTVLTARRVPSVCVNVKLRDRWVFFSQDVFTKPREGSGLGSGLELCTFAQASDDFFKRRIATNTFPVTLSLDGWRHDHQDTFGYVLRAPTAKKSSCVARKEPQDWRNMEPECDIPEGCVALIADPRDDCR